MVFLGVLDFSNVELESSMIHGLLRVGRNQRYAHIVDFFPLKLSHFAVIYHNAIQHLHNTFNNTYLNSS